MNQESVAQRKSQRSVDSESKGVEGKRLKFKYQVLYNEQYKKGKITISSRNILIDFKRKLIKRLGYQESESAKAELQMMIYLEESTPYYLTIQSDANFQYMIERQLHIQYEESITFRIINLYSTEFALKLTHQAVEFDSDGSIQQIDKALHLITPSMPSVDPRLNVRCAFCQKSQHNKEVLKQCGRVYGPIGKNYFHLLCAIWCPEIFLDEDGKLEGVQKQVDRSKMLYCELCGIRGAGLCCYYERCHTSAHFLCAVQNGYEMDWEKYILFCSSKCKAKAENMPQKPLGAQQMRGQIPEQEQQQSANNRQISQEKIPYIKNTMREDRANNNQQGMITESSRARKLDKKQIKSVIFH